MRDAVAGAVLIDQFPPQFAKRRAQITRQLPSHLANRLRLARQFRAVVAVVHRAATGRLARGLDPPPVPAKQFHPVHAQVGGDIEPSPVAPHRVRSALQFHRSRSSPRPTARAVRPLARRARRGGLLDRAGARQGLGRSGRGEGRPPADARRRRNFREVAADFAAEVPHAPRRHQGLELARTVRHTLPTRPPGVGRPHRKRPRSAGARGPKAGREAT